MGLSFQPFDLRIDCGRWKDLDFTDNPRPTFSWAVQGTGSGQYQAYGCGCTRRTVGQRMGQNAETVPYI